MSNEPIKLEGVQLAYARTIAAIELQFYDGRYRDDEGNEPPLRAAEQIVRQLEDEANLRSVNQWRHRTPLIDLYNFSEGERALLLDLADNGGVQITRNHDSRFHRLGQCQGEKGAVGVSAQQRWKVELTQRGKALVEEFRKEPQP